MQISRILKMENTNQHIQLLLPTTKVFDHSTLCIVIPRSRFGLYEGGTKE